MLPTFHSNEKNVASKKKLDCTCASIKLDDCRDSGQAPPLVGIECSSHPGFCVLNNKGVCTKHEGAIHCSEVSLKSLGEALLIPKEKEAESKKNCCESKMSGLSCTKKKHYYKIDLNNSQETGLIADKQCQTCGPDCGPETCSKRSREYFISWDRVRSKLLIFLIVIFCLWLCIYSALSSTSSL